MSRRTIRARLAAEDGFTLIELLASMVILAIGVFALIASFDQSRGLANQSESQVAAAAVAERQLDAGLAVPFSKLSLVNNPQTTATAAANGGTAALDTKWKNVLDHGTESSSATSSPIVPTPATANRCSTILSPFTVYSDALPNNEQTCVAACPAVSGIACGSVGIVLPYSVVSDAKGNRFEVYRYVTWVNDVSCGLLCPNPGLPTATAAANVNPWFGDYKRLTIAVQVLDRGTAAGATLPYHGLKKPVIVQAVKIDPSRGTANTPGGLSVLQQPGVIG